MLQRWAPSPMADSGMCRYKDGGYVLVADIPDHNKAIRQAAWERLQALVWFDYISDLARDTMKHAVLGDGAPTHEAQP